MNGPKKNKNRGEEEEIMNIFTDRSRRTKTDRQKNDFLFLILLGTNILHLNALGLDIWDTVPALL